MSTTNTGMPTDMDRRGRRANRGAGRSVSLGNSDSSQESTALAATPDMHAIGVQHTRDQLDSKQPADFNGRLETDASEEAEAQVTATDSREALWAGYCRFALNLHRRGKLPGYQDDLRSGRCPDVDSPQLMNAATEFVTHGGRLGPSRWSPAPTDEQLEDLPGWTAQRLAEQEAAERCRRWQRSLSRELGKGDAVNRSLKYNKNRNPEMRDAIQAAIDRYERGEATADDYQLFLDPGVMIHCTGDQCVQFEQAFERMAQITPPAVVTAFRNWLRIRAQQNSVEKRREKEEQRKRAVQGKEEHREMVAQEARHD